jgi:Protein of unknown function (DUF2959)
MINTYRAMGISLTALALVVGALALASLPGCASDKKPEAAKPAPTPPPQPVSLTKIKSELVDAKSQLQLTNDSLNKLQKSSQADAQTNYNAFTEQYLKLQAKADAVSKRSKDLKERAASYRAIWDKQAQVDNPELRKQAMQQKADAEQVYNNIRNEMQLARLSFDPYMANLKDVGNYLRGNLTPANLTSVGDLVTKANGQAKEVDGHIAAIVTSIDKITTATGEGTAAAAAAPAAAPAPEAAPAAAPASAR